MDTSSDLQTKYQKIASEYSKIRAQMAVLKTAVLEERSQNAELKDFVKSKDQGLRKAEQEMDSLNFRNQQLAKRVAFLQDELDAMQVKSKKGKSRGSSINSHEAEQANHVLDEEFRNKIEENARLLSLIQDKDMAHEQEVAALMQRLKRLEHEQQQQEQISQASEEKLKSMIERLEKENSLLLSKDNSLETLSGEPSSPQLGKHLIANTTIQQNSPTKDSRKSDLTAPSLNLKHQQQLRVEVLTQVGHYLRDLTSALSDYHTYTEQRLHAVWDQLSPANIKFSSHLKENARHLRSLDQAYSEFLQGLEKSEDHSVHSETRPVLQSLVSQLANYSNYLQKLLPYQDLSLQEESLMVSSTESLRESNSAVSQYITGFTSHFVKLERCVKLLALQDKHSGRTRTQSERKFLLEFTDSLTTLHEALKDLSRAWSHKRSIEQQLPTSSERLRTTDACLVNALSAVSSSAGKLSGLLLDSRSELCTPLSNEFPSEILKYPHPAVVGEDEIKGKEQAENDVMSRESLSKQLSGVTQRATKLEQEREHWRLEYQLLQLKYDKKLNEFENKLKAGNLERNNIQTALNSFDRSAPTSVTNMLGSLDCPLPPLQAEAEAREQEVKNYFTNRINELVVVSQETETKAAILAGECSSLQHRLELCQSGKQQSAEDLSEALEKLTRLQEELQTTTENYEVQLSIMSEHLANMNEKLTLQRDEIDQLKYQLTNKPSRKGKQK